MYRQKGNSAEELLSKYVHQILDEESDSDHGSSDISDDDDIGKVEKDEEKEEVKRLSGVGKMKVGQKVPRKDSNSNVKKEKPINKKEIELPLLQFKKLKRSNKSFEGAKKVFPPPKTKNKGVLEKTPASVKPERFECFKCAKYFITEGQLRNHLMMAKTMKWVCSVSGQVSLKRKTASDDLDEIALPRRKLINNNDNN